MIRFLRYHNLLNFSIDSDAFFIANQIILFLYFLAEFTPLYPNAFYFLDMSQTKRCILFTKLQILGGINFFRYLSTKTINIISAIFNLSINLQILNKNKLNLNMNSFDPFLSAEYKLSAKEDTFNKP